MAVNNIFIFKNINSTKVGTGIIYWGILTLTIVIFLGSIRPSFTYIIIISILAVLIGRTIFKCSFEISTLTFILNSDNIEIIIDKKGTQIIPLSDFYAIRTLDPSNQKNASLQFEILNRDKKIGFFKMMAKDQQKVMSFLCNALLSTYNFEVNDVPFSIWTHNFSKVKYIEYKNPSFEGK